jgi:hypothetical protein
MLKPGRPDGTERDLNSLVLSRNAVQYLYEESLGNGNPQITAILGEALTCGEALIATGQEISHEPKDGLFYLCFLRAILGLHPEQIRHLVALLEWLGIIHADKGAGNPRPESLASVVEVHK